MKDKDEGATITKLHRARSKSMSSGSMNSNWKGMKRSRSTQGWGQIIIELIVQWIKSADRTVFEEEMLLLLWLKSSRA